MTEDLPPVARGYMSQIFLGKYPESSIRLRNLREMRTLTTVLDLLASNQILQAMDIVSQRIKSVELFVTQGHWAQGSLLELVAAEGEQRAYTREEMKVAQIEGGVADAEGPMTAAPMVEPGLPAAESSAGRQGRRG